MPETDDVVYNLDYLTEEQLRRQTNIEHDKRKQFEENKVTIKDKVYLYKINLIIVLLILILVGIAITVPVVLSMNTDSGKITE